MKNTFNLRYNVYTITQKVYIHLPFNWKGDRYLIIIKIQTSFGMKNIQYLQVVRYFGQLTLSIPE